MSVTAELGRRAMFAGLARMRSGRLEIAEDGRSFGFGAPDSSLRARVEVHDRRAYPWALRGSTGLGEGYVEGLWRVDDLVALSRIACRNLGPLDALRQRLQPLIGPLQRAGEPGPREHPRRGARQHLRPLRPRQRPVRGLPRRADDVLVRPSSTTPGRASSRRSSTKLERICDALELGPDDHLLEIGTGWGGLAVHAAETRGCRVTTTTISREQHALRRRAGPRAAGLGDRVELLLTDYRDLGGTYDKLVSIEMIEAVGWQYFERFFAKCAELTRPAGAMFLQAIVIGDRALRVGEGRARASPTSTSSPAAACLRRR